MQIWNGSDEYCWRYRADTIPSTDGQTDKVKPVYPFVEAGGIKNCTVVSHPYNNQRNILLDSPKFSNIEYPYTHTDFLRNISFFSEAATNFQIFNVSIRTQVFLVTSLISQKLQQMSGFCFHTSKNTNKCHGVFLLLKHCYNMKTFST